MLQALAQMARQGFVRLRLGPRPLGHLIVHVRWLEYAELMRSRNYTATNQISDSFFDEHGVTYEPLRTEDYLRVENCMQLRAAMRRLRNDPLREGEAPLNRLVDIRGCNVPTMMQMAVQPKHG